MADTDTILLSDTPTESPSVPAKEGAILAGRPVEVIETATGLKLPIYPKPQGYFYRIEEASNVYIEALMRYNLAWQKRGFQLERFRLWPFSVLRETWPWRPLRVWRRRLKVLQIEDAKYHLLRLIFEDAYRKEKDTDFTREQFYAIDHAEVVAILGAYRKANDVSDILRKLDPDYESKKKLYDPVTNRGLMQH